MNKIKQLLLQYTNTEKLLALSVSLCIFFIPFQIKAALFDLPVYFSGKFNPFTSFSIYLSDIFLIISLILFGFSLLKNPKKKITLGPSYISTFLFLILIISEILIFFAQSPIVSLLHTARIFEIFCFYFLLINNNKYLLYLKTFIGSTIPQAFIAIFQYIKQGSAGFYFLGEPSIGKEILGVAKIDAFGTKVIRSYGTLPHPNILGGILCIGIFLTIVLLPGRKRIYIPILIIQIIGLILTFSRSAIIGLLIGLIIYLFFKKRTKILKINPFKNIKSILISLLIVSGIIGVLTLTPFLQRIFVNTQEIGIKERFELLSISKDMLIQKPYGVGLGQFTLNIQQVSQSKIPPWKHQPVHNSFLLLLNELGPLAFILTILILTKITKELFSLQKKLLTKNKLRTISLIFSLFTAVFLIMSFDHYFYSLYQGQMLIPLLLSLIYYSKLIAKPKIKKIGIQNFMKE